MEELSFCPAAKATRGRLRMCNASGVRVFRCSGVIVAGLALAIVCFSPASSAGQGTEPDIPKIVLPVSPPSTAQPDKSKQPSAEPDIPAIGIPQSSSNDQSPPTSEPPPSSGNSIFAGLALNKEGV